MHKLFISLCLAALVLAGCYPDKETGQSADEQPTSEPAVADPSEAQAAVERQFRFVYAAELADVPADSKVKIWMPIAEDSPQQKVEIANKKIPGDLKLNRDAVYANQIGFFEVSQSAAGQPIAFSVEYDVTRNEAGLDSSELTLDETAAKKFLDANRLVPKSGKPIELLADQSVPKDAKAAGELLYEVVESHMKYDKSKPGYGNGDSIWACDSKTGNCTDFHSLFISLARSQNIPARFQIGFPIAPDKASGSVGGYHCWAWFHVDGQGWLPVDISEADKHPQMKKYYCGNLTKDRVTFSTGRDIKLVPASESEPLNYFVYPHVEVDGKVWPKDKIKLSFSYSDQADSDASDNNEAADKSHTKAK